MNNSDKTHPALSKTPAIEFPGTGGHEMPWKFYNHLIGKIPDDIFVKDYSLGTRWSYVEAESGMGVSLTCKGGTKRRFTHDLRGLPLKSVAELAKSWCFEEASLGVAALNAYYAQKPLLDPLGAIYDSPVELPDGSTHKMSAFELYRPRILAQKELEQREPTVVVVGHFPHVEDIASYARLIVLERNCTQEIDVPDPACEYVIPHADYLFATGVTIINKTAPRLLELGKKATTILVGPSVVMSPFLLHWDVETLAGSVVADPEKVRFAVHNGTGQFFGEALQMAALTNKK